MKFEFLRCFSPIFIILMAGMFQRLVDILRMSCKQRGCLVVN